MSAKHTPGPWHLRYNGKHDGDRSVVGRSRDICAMDGGPSDDMETLANARLIAAAPELLEACKAGLAMLETARRYFPESARNSDTFSLLNVTANTIKPAIAKAEGRV